MTTLAITPNWKNKGAKFKGTVAAGEHVSVTIQNDNGEGEKVIDDASTLRLRVVGMDGRTLAIFPEPVTEGETPETWGEEDLTPLTCTLNLNTVQMLKAVPPAANVPLLWVLDDYDNKTLYFKEQFEVTHWPRKFGEEEPTPTDLDDYKDIIEDFNTRLTAAEQTAADAAANAQSAANSASAAAASAAAAATAATDAQTGAIASKNAAQTAAGNAATSAQAASEAEDNAAQAASDAESARAAAATSAAEAAESAAAFVVDDTLSVEGAAADAKAVGEAKQDLITKIDAAQDDLDAEVTARQTLAGAVQVDRQNLANEIARAQSAEAALRADVTSAQTAIADRYTKTEVDAKIAGVQTFQKYLVQTLPDPDEADMKGLYLVPTGETSEEGDLCEEWTVVEEDGEKRWEKIGAKAVDLTLDNTVTRTSANGVKSSGIWSAIWGALAALPTGFASLYDWCVAQLAGKASKADVDPLLFAQYYPDGSVKSAAEFTAGIKYGSFDTTNRTVSVLPFCNTGDSANDNSDLIGRVVIPPFVDAQGNPYITDDGTRFKVVGVSNGGFADDNTNLTAIIAPSTVTNVGSDTFYRCTSLASVSLPAVTDIGADAFASCTSLSTVDFGDTPRSFVPSLGINVFYDVPSTCKIIVPYTQYDDWKAASGWKDLPQEFVRHSEKADKPATFTAGNLAALDESGNPTDSGIAKTSVATMPQTGLDNNLVKISGAGGLEDAGWTAGDLARYALVTKTITNGAVTLDDRAINIVTIDASVASVTFTFPARTDGKARDFFIRLVIQGATPPTISFVEPGGGAVSFDSADGQWAAIDAGVNIIMFTDTAE